MEEKYSCFKTSDQREVLELLEKWRKNGWHLPHFLIKITHGPGGFHVFYDTKLDEAAKG